MIATPNLKEIPGDDILVNIKDDLITLCEDQILSIMAAEQINMNYSITINLIEFNSLNPVVVNKFLQFPKKYFPFMQTALEHAQTDLLSKPDLGPHLIPKPHIRIRFSFEGASLIPEFCKTKVPRSSEVDKFISIKGTIIRTGMIKMLETKKIFQCAKCKQNFSVEYDVEQFNIIPKPYHCEAGKANGCDGTKFKEIQTDVGEVPHSCQEVKIQEQVNKLSVGTIPRSMIVILQHDLVDSCKAGDDVTISGFVIRRWRNLNAGDRCELEIALLANHIRVHNEQRASALATDEAIAEFEQFWQKYSNDQLKARDIIVSSVCSKLYGLYVVKLAVLLVLIGGVPRYDKTGVKTRGDAHMLLVGDPGTGKSQFLNFATKVTNRSVLTTGIGSTNAGLTVTAVKDSGEWQLEAGALVLADRGICCIDEFGSIRESDKTAIHEAMEQQTISVAKAGLVCKLNTRCSIIAATNAKGKYDIEQSISVNVALASPLLSRIDIILVLFDSQNDEWDKIVSSYILGNETEKDQSIKPANNNDEPSKTAIKTSTGNLEEEQSWSIDKLQAYISYVKSNFRPILSEESHLVLSNYYQMQRSADLRNAARTTIRLLESSIRIAQAHAKLMCQDEVTVCDAVAAVLLLDASSNTSALAEIQSTLHQSFPEDPSAEHIRQETIMLRRLGLEHLAVHCKYRKKSSTSPNRNFVQNYETEKDEIEIRNENCDQIESHITEDHGNFNEHSELCLESCSSHEPQAFEFMPSQELNLIESKSIFSSPSHRGSSPVPSSRKSAPIQNLASRQHSQTYMDTKHSYPVPNYIPDNMKMRNMSNRESNSSTDHQNIPLNFLPKDESSMKQVHSHVTSEKNHGLRQNSPYPNNIQENAISKIRPIAAKRQAKHLSLLQDLDLGGDDEVIQEFMKQTGENDVLSGTGNLTQMGKDSHLTVFPSQSAATQIPDIGITPNQIIAEEKENRIHGALEPWAPELSQREGGDVLVESRSLDAQSRDPLLRSEFLQGNDFVTMNQNQELNFGMIRKKKKFMI